MPDIPSPQTYFLETPLYDPIGVGPEDANAILELQFFDRTVDAFCLWCETQSVFDSLPDFVEVRVGQGRRKAQSLSQVRKTSGVYVPSGNRVIELTPPKYAVLPRRFENRFVCARCRLQALVFYSDLSDGHLRKVGQLPALADLHLPDLQPYRGILSAARYGELARGIGLAAHGIGIGAFVYLRRVFESLVEEAHVQASEDNDDWDEDAYLHGRMADRIRLLDQYLPEFLVENRALYSVLSLGVHELTEEDCLAHFEVVRAGIELILDEKIEADRKARKIEATRKSVAALENALGERRKS